MIAAIVVLIMVSPLILGPLVIPVMYSFQEKKLLARLEKAVSKNIDHGYHAFRDREWIRDRCDRATTISCSERVCDGKLVDIEEHFVTIMKEAGKELRSGPVLVCIGMLCLRCGYLNTRGRRSYLFKEAYTYMKNVEQLISLLEMHQRKIDHTLSSSVSDLQKHAK